MSASHEWQEWHLTPDGWKVGTFEHDFGQKPVVEPPPDRVMTCRYHATIPSTFGGDERYVETVWTSDDEESVKNFIGHYGNCPKRFGGQQLTQ